MKGSVAFLRHALFIGEAFLGSIIQHSTKALRIELFRHDFEIFHARTNLRQISWMPFKKFSEMDSVFWHHLLTRDISLEHFMKKIKCTCLGIETNRFKNYSFFPCHSSSIN